jgi:hypothetical protein
VADPRRRTVGLFLDLGRSFPAVYPQTASLEQAIAIEQMLARAMDYGLIAPRLPELYEFAAGCLEQPRLTDQLNDGTPAYAWPPEQRRVWYTGSAVDRYSPASPGRPPRPPRSFRAPPKLISAPRGAEFSWTGTKPSPTPSPRAERRSELKALPQAGTSAVGVSLGDSRADGEQAGGDERRGMLAMLC